MQLGSGGGDGSASGRGGEGHDALARRAFHVFERTCEHLRCDPEELIHRLDDGRLWFLLDLVERAESELEGALGGRAGGGGAAGPVSPPAVRRAATLLGRARRILAGLGGEGRAED